MTSGVRVLIAANFAVFVLSFVLTMALEGSLIDRPFSLYLGLSWNAMWEGYGLGLLRLITAQFAHSYEDPLHFVGNMIVLYFFGTFVESEVGRRGIFHLYLVSGLIGGIGQLGVGALMGELDVPGIGASGACYGIMLYAACMAPRMQVIFIVFPIQMRWLVGILVGLGVYSLALELRGHGGSSIGHGAHLGGALWGWIAFRRFRGYYLALNYRDGPMLPWLDRWKADRGRRKEEDLQATLDRLLEKVSREGMSALTSGERRQLERASKELKKR